MTGPTTEEIRIVSVNGMLGYGYELESLKAGIADTEERIRRTHDANLLNGLQLALSAQQCPQRLVVPHAAGRVVGSVTVRQRRLRPGVLLGVVVLPLDRHRSVEADAV